MNRYDVAVVGGGPAGCSAAIALASQGARVVLFEAAIYPHPKVCGEFLSPECLTLLKSLGISRLEGVPISTAYLTAPDGTVWKTSLPGQAWGITRSAFDAALAEKASQSGVEVRDGAAVSTIEGSFREGFIFQTHSHAGEVSAGARVAIGAQGKRSILDRALQRRFLKKRQPYVALKAHFQGLSLPDRIELHGFPGGYCGMSEVEGGAANVCLLVQQSVFRAAGGLPEPFIRWMQSQNPHIKEWLSHAEPLQARWLSIGQIPFVTKGPVEREILMVGDAAGLITPLVGDGIAMALQSGQMAAEQIAQYLQGSISARQLQDDYRRIWTREFQGRLRLSRLLQTLAFRPRLLSLTLRSIAALPPLGTLLIKQTRSIGLIGDA